MSSESDAVSVFGEKASEKSTAEIQEGEAVVVAETLQAAAPDKETGETQEAAAPDKETGETQEAAAAHKKHADETEEENGPKMLILRSSDGHEFEVAAEAAKASLMIKNMINDGCADGCVPLPNVKAAELAKLVEYLNHHAGATEEEMSAVKGWNAEFVDVEKEELFDIMLAANFLEVKPLLDLTCQTVANRVKDMTVEDVREYFDVKNDYTPEEEAELREANKWAFDLP